MGQVTFNEVLDAIEHLPIEEQVDLLEVVQRRLAERGRARVVQESHEGRREFSDGTTKVSSVDDIMGEIHS